MSERTPPSLMLIDSSADERRLIAATASRAGWMVVSAADQETAVGLLQGPHGREVKTAIVGGWHESEGPQLIAALREVSPALPVIVLSDKESVGTPEPPVAPKGKEAQAGLQGCEETTVLAGGDAQRLFTPRCPFFKRVGSDDKVVNLAGYIH